MNLLTSVSSRRGSILPTSSPLPTVFTLGASARQARLHFPASITQKTQQYEIDASGSTTSYTYDANGNLTSDGTKTYFWNALNQLVEVKEGSTTIATFAYDGAGRRTEKVAGIDPNQWTGS